MFGFWGSKEVRLEIENIPNTVNEAKELKELNKSFSRSIEDFRNDLFMLQESVNALNAKTSENTYSNMVKNKFCARALEILDGIDYPNNVFSAGDFYGSMKNKMDELSSLSIKEFRHLHTFKDEMKSVADSIKSMESGFGNIGKVLNYPVSKTAIKIRKDLMQINSIQMSLEGEKNKIKGIASKITETEDYLKEKRLSIQKALQSSEYARLEMIRNEMEKLRRNEMTIERKISEEFASMDRIFKKFSHINSYEKELVEKYMNDGFSAFLDDEDNKVRIILDKMRVAIETGKIGIEEKKYQKLLDILRSMSLFESLRRQYKELKNQQALMDDDIPPIESEIRRLQNEIESSENAIAKLRKDLEIRNRSTAVSTQKMDEIKAGLTSAMSELLGKKTVIIN